MGIIGNRSKRYQETHTITAAKFECKILVVCKAMHACCFQSNFAADIMFGPIAGAIIPITQSRLQQIMIVVVVLVVAMNMMVAMMSYGSSLLFLKHCGIGHLKN